MPVALSAATFIQLALGPRACFLPTDQGPLPGSKDGTNLNLDLPAGFVPLTTFCEQLVVGSLVVADMCDDSQPHSLFVESLRCGRSAHPAAVPETGVLRDHALGTGRAVRKHLAHTSCKTLDVILVDFRTALSLALTTARTRFTIGEAVRFGLYQCRFLDQNALSLIAVSGAAPLEDNSRERGVLTRATGQSRLPRPLEDEMIKVSAGKALRTTFPGEGDPCAASQRLPALIA